MLRAHIRNLIVDKIEDSIKNTTINGIKIISTNELANS